jgi:hypothetical protein
MILGSIKLSSIDKAKLYTDKKGEKWLDVVLIDTPGNKYGDDYMIVQGVSKEERQAGVKGAILGNAKNYGQPVGSSPKPAPKPATSGPRFEEDHDIPF